MWPSSRRKGSVSGVCINLSRSSSKLGLNGHRGGNEYAEQDDRLNYTDRTDLAERWGICFGKDQIINLSYECDRHLIVITPTL